MYYNRQQHQLLPKPRIASLQPLEMVKVEPPEDTESQKSVNRGLRLEKYEQTHELRQQGYSIKDIAHHLGIGKRTAYTYLAAATFPERQPTIRQRGSGLDPYKPYLKQRWSLGYQQTKVLFQEIQQQGYCGSYPTLARFTQQLRQLQPPLKPARESLNHLPGRGAAPKMETATQKPLSARRAAWLILQHKETFLIPLCVYLKRCFGRCSGISFIDSTSLKVCHNRRISPHRVFNPLAARGKTSALKIERVQRGGQDIVDKR